MAIKKAGKYKKLTIKSGSGDTDNISLYVGPKIHASFKTIAEKLDFYESGQLFNLLEATLEEGKRLGRAEVMPQVIDMKKQFGKIIDGIEKSTNYKKPGRPRLSAKAAPSKSRLAQNP